MRNRQMIVHWLMAHTNASMCDGVAADLPSWSTPPRFTGRRPAARGGAADRQRATTRPPALFDTYGFISTRSCGEVVARVDRLGLPSHTGS
jgi:hypothetical protein